MHGGVGAGRRVAGAEASRGRTRASCLRRLAEIQVEVLDS